MNAFISKKLGSVFCNNTIIASLMAKFITFNIIIQSNLWVDLFLMLPNEKKNICLQKNIFVPCNTMPEIFQTKGNNSHSFIHFFAFCFVREKIQYKYNLSS